MNDKPHVHEPKVAREFPILNSGPWQVTYGDTRVRICRESRLPTEKQIIKATKKAIRQHDEGSIQAGKQMNYSQVAQRVVSEWGKE